MKWIRCAIIIRPDQRSPLRTGTGDEILRIILFGRTFTQEAETIIRDCRWMFESISHIVSNIDYRDQNCNQNLHCSNSTQAVYTLILLLLTCFFFSKVRSERSLSRVSVDLIL